MVVFLLRFPFFPPKKVNMTLMKAPLPNLLGVLNDATSKSFAAVYWVKYLQSLNKNRKKIVAPKQYHLSINTWPKYKFTKYTCNVNPLITVQHTYMNQIPTTYHWGTFYYKFTLTWLKIIHITWKERSIF